MANAWPLIWLLISLATFCAGECEFRDFITFLSTLFYVFEVAAITQPSNAHPTKDTSIAVQIVNPNATHWAYRALPFT